MKSINKIVILSLGLFIIACAGKDKLSEKKEELKSKKEELKKLKAEIKTLEEEIVKLGGNTSDKNKKLPTVKTQTIASSTFEHFIEIQGVVEADNMITLSTEVPGKIDRIYVKEGQIVGKGQKIAKINSELIQKQIDEINTSYDLAKTVYQKQKNLWDQKIGTEIQFIQAKNNKEKLEKALATAKAQYNKTVVYSPIGGTIDQLIAKTGEMIASGMPIAQVVNISKIEVKAELSEKYIPKVKRGMEVFVDFPALDIELKAKVNAISEVINPGNRTVNVIINVPNKKKLIRPNALANVKLKDFEKENSIVVPTNAITFGEKEKFVFVVENGVAKKRIIDVAETYESKSLISSGLSEGDEIVTSGQSRISDGMKINQLNK